MESIIIIRDMTSLKYAEQKSTGEIRESLKHLNEYISTETEKIILNRFNNSVEIAPDSPPITLRLQNLIRKALSQFSSKR